MALLLFCALFVCTALAAPTLSPRERAQQLLAQMNQQEKIAMVHGYGAHGGTSGYVGFVAGNARLGIPELHLEDGPQGVADGVPDVTAFPSALTVVASWDEELMTRYAAAMAEEQRIKGSNIMLGPMMNIARVPRGGRNFESFGEDPFLAARMAAASVTGIQSVGVMGCAKHFVDNNQENDRTSVSANIDERTQYELYYPAFRAAVKAGVGSIMCSYNRVNDVYACENNVTLNKGLKQDMGFQGFVMSDWGATHSTVLAANAGLDMEMPDHDFFGDALASAVASGAVPQSRLDDMVLRILTAMYSVGIMDTPQTGSLTASALSADHNALARELAATSTVLLQNNNNLLPLQQTSVRSIAVIGDQTMVTGGGSGGVITPYVVTPADGIGGYFTGNRTVNCRFEQDIDYYQAGSPSVPADSKEECCKLCTVRATCNYFTFVPGSPHGVCYLKVTNAGRVAHPGIVSGGCSPYTGPNITYYSGDDLAAAIAGAKAADVAVVVGATSSSEGGDRADLTLGKWDEIIEAVTVAQPRNVVVVRNPGAVLMPWRPQAGAIIAQFMPGQEAGNALADVLFGTVNPSARLPVTFPNDEGETWLLGPQQYPGINKETVYSEQLLVGYKWYDYKGLTPLFPFGHGLSYTTFAYSALSVSGSVSQGGSVMVSFIVTNTGRRAGAEIPQLYVTFPSVANEPPQQLRGFAKLTLDPGASDTVSIQLSADDVSIWNVSTHAWTVMLGRYRVAVGASSRDLRLHGSFVV